MTSGTTRRGFLRTGVGAALGGAACRPGIEGERVAEPKTAPSPGASARVDVATTINGTACTFAVGPDDSALEVVRGAGHTGAKLGCGHGACGACTMLVDGQPVVTCLLPATALAKRAVRTVEGLANGETLHPVQRAFMAEDALQCGYCTPGFVVEAVAFYDRWHAERGNAEPSRDEIAEALCGHLCRCGAYEGIYRAVAAACTGKIRTGPPPRVEARDKVTGVAVYTVDVALPGMLHARSLHAPWAHARVRRLDWTRALAMPGVRGIVDVLGPSRLVRFAGQEIVAIAAVDEATAAAAVAAVEIDVDVMPALLTIEAALAPGAAPIYPRGDRKNLPNATEGPLLPERWEGNRRGPLELLGKRADKAKRAIDEARSTGFVADGSYRTAVQCHSALEPHAAVASWDGARGLTMYLSTQGITSLSHDLAQRYGLREDEVRVVAEHVGGGFGGKATLQTEAIIAADLAKVCGAPVRYVLGRRMEIMLGGNRPGSEIEVSVATDSAGELVGMSAATTNTAGVAVGTVTSIMFRLIYPKAPRALSDADVVTHAPPGKPFRGPGGPPAFFALEQTIDALAYARGEDQLVVRKRWDPSPARRPLYDWAQTIPQWRDRPPVAADTGRYRRGIGVAAGAWFAFVEPVARLQLEHTERGLVASCATQDIGNGVRTTIARIIAERFDLASTDVTVRIGDSRYVPGPMAGGSRTTSSIVGPCIDACEKLQAELVDIASRRWKLAKAEPERGGVRHEGGVIEWREVLKVAPKLLVVGTRPRDKGGYFLPPVGGLAAERYVAASLQISQVEVDTQLGKIRVLESWLGAGVGRIASPVLARSQAEGGVIQGIGYALYEERRLDPRAGFLLSSGLEDYRIPGIGDIGPIHVHFDEHGYEKVPGHNVGLGELVTLTPAAAIANAVYHATKWRPTELPIRPDRVLEGLKR